MAFVSDKQAVGLFNNTNPFTAPGGSMPVADNVTIYKQDEIEGRLPFERCSNGLPLAAPKNLFVFDDTLLVHINNQMWYEESNCTYKQIPSPGIPLYEPRHFAMSPTDSDTIYMIEDSETFQTYKDVARLKISNTFADTFLGVIANTYSYPPGSDGTGSSVRFSSPYGIVCDSNYAYIADTGSSTIRRADLVTGVTTTIAGVLNTSGNVDGPLGTNRLLGPMSLCLDSATNTIYFFESRYLVLPISLGFRFKKLDIASGVVTTISANSRTSIDGYGIYSCFTTPTSSYVYFSCINRFRTGTGSTSFSFEGYAVIRLHKTTGAITDFCGLWDLPGDAVGAPGDTRFNDSGQITGDLSNTYLYVASKIANRIVRIEVATGNSSYLFGSGFPDIAEGNGTNCLLNNPSAIWLNGNDMWIGCAKLYSAALGRYVYGGILRADMTTLDVKIYVLFNGSSTRAPGFLIGEIREPVP